MVKETCEMHDKWLTVVGLFRPLMSKSADCPLSSVLIMLDGITVIAGSQTGIQTLKPPR